MARKETFITIDAAGRDQSKVFYIKEMSASQAEWWALRALMAMGRGGVEIPDNLRSMGIAAMAVEGLKAISKIPRPVTIQVNPSVSLAGGTTC
ncbi:hypothetical protein ISX56_29290, partial [Serratia ureilytica]|nr:hypothetical protein [Serratia ureilytica]